MIEEADHVVGSDGAICRLAREARTTRGTVYVVRAVGPRGAIRWWSALGPGHGHGWSTDPLRALPLATRADALAELRTVRALQAEDGAWIAAPRAQLRPRERLELARRARRVYVRPR